MSWFSWFGLRRFWRCETCGGVGEWRDADGDDPKAGQWFRDNDSDEWTAVCRTCRGIGWTSHGRRVGRRGRLFAGRHWGFCYRCKTPWAFVEGHTTEYSVHSGCFPLCEACWAELSPEERLPFYERLWAEWQASGTDKTSAEWDQIETAVKAGL